MRENDQKRQTALAMLKRGDGVITEVARALGVTRQVVSYWSRTAGMSHSDIAEKVAKRRHSELSKLARK